VKIFEVNIQFGAILSVVVFYTGNASSNRSIFTIKLGVAFIPAAVLGFLLNDYIDARCSKALRL
jgi:undecaprenyl-diphosphatase